VGDTGFEPDKAVTSDVLLCLVNRHLAQVNIGQ